MVRLVRPPSYKRWRTEVRQRAAAAAEHNKPPSRLRAERRSWLAIAKIVQKLAAKTSK